MALEVANQKSDGSRICFPTHLREKQTVSSDRQSAMKTYIRKNTEGSRKRTVEITSSFIPRSLQKSC
jgi:hypothetical protein